jgi:hypothetical protein
MPITYHQFLERLEPDLLDNRLSVPTEDICLASIAISAKRIADAVERITSTDGLFALIDEVRQLADASDEAKPR